MLLTTLDYIILAVLAISALVGVVRGLIREILALLSWIVSLWLAFYYAEEAAGWLTPYLNSPQIQYLVALAAIFVGSLLILSMIAMILVKLLDWVGIAGTDRTLGGLFGLLRGIAVALVIVFVVRLTPGVNQSWFLDSVLVPYFEPIYEYLDNQDFIQPLEESVGSG